MTSPGPALPAGVALSTASRVLNGERGHRVAEGTRERVLRKTQVVPSGHDPADYVVERIDAPASDGALIPVTMVSMSRPAAAALTSRAGSILGSNSGSIWTLP